MRESQCEKFTGVNSWNAVNQALLDIPCPRVSSPRPPLSPFPPSLPNFFNPAYTGDASDFLLI